MKSNLGEKMKKYLMIFLFFYASNLLTQEQGLIQQAYDAYLSKDFKKSIDLYSEVLEKHSSYAPAFYGRGLAYAKLDQCNMAIKDFENAVKFDKTLADAFYAKAICEIKLGLNQQAISSINSAIEISKTKPEYFYTRGLIFYYQNEWERSVNDFNKTIEIDPNFCLAYYARAAANYHLKQKAKSLNDFQTYLRMCGNKHNLANETQRLINVLQQPED